MIKRVVIPDSHGCYIDKVAAQAVIRDIKRIKPEEIVFLGDHVDASGLFSRFRAQFIKELDYKYGDDVDAASKFVKQVREAAPNADIYYLEGNHEWHVERWIAETFDSSNAEAAERAFGPYYRLKLESLGIVYIRRSDKVRGTDTRGLLSLDGCYFVHGASAAKWATGIHLDIYGANICHGHTHRAVSVVRRRPDGTVTGAYCPGTLAEFAPLYMHTLPDQWTHGYGLQFIDRHKLFHYNVPILGGKTILP